MHLIDLLTVTTLESNRLILLWQAKEIVRGILPLVAASGGVLYAANRSVVDSSGDVFYPYASVAGTAWLVIVGSANQYLLWNADPALYAAALQSVV